MKQTDQTITLRQATPSDSELVYKIKKQTLREYVEQVWGWDEEFQRQLHAQRFASGGIQFIECDGDIAGALSVSERDKAVWLQFICLLPEYQNKGIATGIIKKVIEDATKIGLPVRLKVFKINPAFNLYSRLGFRTYEEDDVHFLMEHPV